jgi:Domain of unknown function (DUF4258)
MWYSNGVRNDDRTMVGEMDCLPILRFSLLLIYCQFMKGEPLDPSQARQLIRRIVNSGTVSFSGHAYEEMAKDDLTTVDCTNVLRGGVVEPPEWERGTWRYRVRTNRIYVVVAFRSETHLVVVTAWRVQR